MNIFLLSVTDNLQEDLSASLNEEIKKRGDAVAYISSEPQDDNRPYYLSTIKDYSQISGSIKVDYFDLSKNFSDEDLLKLLNYGTIYLSGGNTYVFMDSANKRGLRSILNKHLENNGLLVGASAGSIMMTPSIDLAGLEDENSPNLQDTKGFGFIDFEFHPHFDSKDEGRLSQYIEKRNCEIYTCKDGSGIFYSNDKINLFGETAKWARR